MPPTTTQQVAPTAGWRLWDRRRWNVELLRHYFGAEGADTRPVRRLSVGPEEVARVAGEPEQADAAWRCFLDTIRAPAQQYNSRLSLESARTWFGGPVPPPFVADLLFTCHVASTLDEATQQIGDFRKRIAALLGHSEDTSYPLTDLGTLWGRLAKWLSERQQAGDAYRTIVLPDPGHEVRIGYSKRLAFPSRKDRIALVNVLRAAEVGREPPMRDVLDLLSRKQASFSEAFRGSIDRARRAYTGARNSADLDLLWSAVREAASLAEEALAHPPVRYQLFATLDDAFRGDLVLMSTGVPVQSPKGLSFERSPFPIGEHAWILSRAADGDGGPASAVRVLLAGALSNLDGMKRCAPGKVVDGGVLLFRRGQDGVRELVATRPEEVDVWAVVSDARFDDFLSLFPATERPSWSTSRFAGWSEVGPFDALHLANVDAQPDSPLSRLRCLQPTRAGTSIHFSGGVRVDGGFLALRGALPAVRVRGATRVVAVLASGSVQANDERVEIELAPGPADTTTFAFPREWGEAVEGRFAVVAYDGSGEIARRHLQLRHRSLDHPLLSPTDGTLWWVEAARRDVVSAADDGRDAFDDALRADSGRRGAPNQRYARRGAQHDTTAASSEPVIAPTSCDVDGDARIDRFVEWSAGLATVRRGIGEAELLEIVENCFGRMEWKERWDLLRALAENCLFDVLTRRNWRGREWYPRPVRLLVTSDDEKGVVLRLTGLANWSTRRRISELLRSHDGEQMAVASFDTRVPPPPRWRLPDTDLAARVARTLGLPVPRRLTPAPDVAMAVDAIVDGTPESPPQGGELRGVWDWERGQFGQPAASSSHDVTIEWRRRMNAPDLYVVRSRQAPDWWTLSRNWALLVAYRMAKMPSHVAVGATLLLRRGESGPHLPLPVARALALDSEFGPGPVRLRSGALTYANVARDAAERARLVARLWGDEDDSARLQREIGRILMLVRGQASWSRRGGRSAGPLPSSLRRRLLELGSVAGSAQLADSMVPAELVPHVRRLLGRATLR